MLLLLPLPTPLFINDWHFHGCGGAHMQADKYGLVTQLSRRLDHTKIKTSGGAVKIPTSTAFAKMPPQPRVSDEERRRIQGLHEAGWSIRAIPRRVGRSDQTVARIVAPKALTEPKKPGPPPVMSDRAVRLVVRKAATGDFSASQIKDHVSSAASLRTIQRVLASVDWLQYAKMDNTLELTAEHKLARREFAKEWLLYSKDVRPRVVFSDETKWNLDGPEAISATGRTCGSRGVKPSGAKTAVVRLWSGVALAAVVRRS
ncbi:unnamed protein product [Phytophthora fragariaefolia]|uniref:Unnamed protein product n=1 Tax=Phytophthora fragariaefolia TaxID=1490495 RepID=A0A9W6WYT1_9STRA|nr:unnamed protein product [Phytophthora fragariaefolia]